MTLRPAATRLVFLATFAALLVVGYGHTLDYPYHFDDFYSIRDNPALDSPGDLGAIWRFRPSRVVTHLSLAWNLAIADSPAALRMVNLLLHAACSLLVGWLAATFVIRLAGPAKGRDPGPGARRDPAAAWVGATAALLFVSHPLLSQAVTYVAQRGTVLAALLELAAVAAFVRARGGGGGTRWWILSWSAALVAGLTKEMSVALPGLVLLVEALLRGAGGGRARAWQLAPYFLVLPLVVATASLPATAHRGEAPIGFVETHEVDRFTYLLTQLAALPRYLSLFVWPSGQSIDHDLPWVHGFGTGTLLGLGLIVGSILVAVAARRRFPLVTLGLLWCLVALAPESSLIPIRDAMVEHRMYLPMAGLVWAMAAALAAAAGWVATRVPAGRAWYPRVGLAVALALAVTTHVRNRVWRDELTLWSDAALRAPGKARPHNNRGMALEQLGRNAEAEAAFRRAIAAESLNVPARVNLSRLYGMNRRPLDALEVLREADRIEPGNPTILNNLGSTWWALGDTAQAAACYERALSAAPGEPAVLANLARLRRLTRP